MIFILFAALPMKETNMNIMTIKMNKEQMQLEITDEVVKEE
ncbi:hypothetical protein [Methanococcoides sp.]|nr:hypothetical protein [Methanococcoides sp.]